MVKAILNLESLLIFSFSLLIFSTLQNVSWLVFVGFWLIPDVSMAGYLLGKKVGSVVYNLAHNYLLATFAVFVGILSQSDVVMAFGLAYVSHVSLDRLIGFGLKYSSGFKDTHMQKV